MQLQHQLAFKEYRLFSTTCFRQLQPLDKLLLMFAGGINWQSVQQKTLDLEYKNWPILESLLATEQRSLEVLEKLSEEMEKSSKSVESGGNMVRNEVQIKKQLVDDFKRTQLFRKRTKCPHCGQRQPTIRDIEQKTLHLDFKIGRGLFIDCIYASLLSIS